MKKPATSSALKPATDSYADCSNCHFRRDVRCLRLPPTVLQSAVVRFPDHDISPGVWPQISPDDWCGEWQIEANT